MPTRTWLRAVLATSLFIVALVTALPSYAGSYPPSCPSGYTPIMSGPGGSPQHPEIVLIFWGPNGEWSGSSEPFTLSQWVGAMLSMVNAPTFSQLIEYGVSRPRMAPYAPIYTNPAPTTGHTPANFTVQDIIEISQEMMKTNLVPQPMSNRDSVYVVILPHTANPAGACGSAGCNFPSDNQDGFNTAYFSGAYVVNGGSGSTSLAEHELVEAMAGSEGANIVCSSCPGKSCQIADVCQDNPTELQNNVQVASYWSALHQRCIIPESWGNLYVDTNNGQGWQAPAGDFYTRQMYGGGGGLVATDAVENGSLGNGVFFYSPGGWLGHCSGPLCRGWTAEQFGNGGSEFAVGGTGSSAIAAGIALDPKYGVNTYPVGQLQFGLNWAALGGPNGQPVTGVLVTSDGVVVVTDTKGQIWHNQSGTWYQVTSQGSGINSWDQVAVHGTSIIATTMDHSSVWELPERGYWSQLTIPFGYCNGNYSVGGIVSGPDSLNFATLYSGSWYAYPNYYNGDNNCIGGGPDYAATNAPNVSLEWLTYNQNDTFAWYNWSSYWAGGGVGGRLISGAEMYVTGCNSGSEPCVNY